MKPRGSFEGLVLPDMAMSNFLSIVATSSEDAVEGLCGYVDNAAP
jgi:hypothetical protein